MSVKITEWGRDHWSLLAYIEYRGVNHKCVLDKKHLRIKNPIVANSTDYPMPMPEWDEKYGTRLRGYDHKNTSVYDLKHLGNHDDLDCIEDMENEGIVENIGSGLNPACKLTKKGQQFANALSKHKQEGSTFAEFGEAIEKTLSDLKIK